MEDIINFYQITENIGTGGQPTFNQLAEVAEANYSVVTELFIIRIGLFIFICPNYHFKK